MSSILKVSGLHAGYGAGDILKGVDVELAAGSILTIIGPNGSGKSTLAKTLAGLLPARAGTVELEGRPLDQLSAPKRVLAGISYVPQEYNVFRNLTVLETLKIAREFFGGDAALTVIKLKRGMQCVVQFLNENNEGANIRIAQAAARIVAFQLIDEPARIVNSDVKLITGVAEKSARHFIQLARRSTSQFA